MTATVHHLRLTFSAALAAVEQHERQYGVTALSEACRRHASAKVLAALTDGHPAVGNHTEAAHNANVWGEVVGYLARRRAGGAS